MKKQLALATVRYQGRWSSREQIIGPSDQPMRVRVRTADEAGLSDSGMPSVEIEQVFAGGQNRRVAHVSLRHESTCLSRPVLRIIGRAEPSLDRPDVDESMVDQPGVYLETHKGYWIRLEEALTILDRHVEEKRCGACGQPKEPEARQCPDCERFESTKAPREEVNA